MDMSKPPVSQTPVDGRKVQIQLIDWYGTFTAYALIENFAELPEAVEYCNQFYIKTSMLEKQYPIYRLARLFTEAAPTYELPKEDFAEIGKRMIEEKGRIER